MMILFAGGSLDQQKREMPEPLPSFYINDLPRPDLVSPVNTEPRPRRRDYWREVYRLEVNPLTGQPFYEMQENE